MSDDDIVVCGIGGRFPGADNVDQFWTLLTNGENHMKDIPPERCDIDKHYDPDPNKPRKSYVKKAALINNIYEWDYNLYGISEREAQTMDPQQRLVLDSVYMAMEDAGITARDLDGSQTAVFIGAMNDDFKGIYYDYAKNIEGLAATGLFPTLISARVSYVFNLLGTAATIDTACSSSLVAIHMACQALKCGECDAAIAGGVNFINNPLAYIVLSKARMLSPTGQCHTFSQEADGYARGEGCGVVILKKLKQAVEDGNPIWGIIKTATNQNGRTVTPVNAPSKIQQLNLLKQMYSDNHVNRDNIQVIEAHGTGTAIGDPTEVDALGEFFSEDGFNNRDHPIAIGSVKTNVGHLESAAGVTGLIKILLMMKHKTIVPSIMYSRETENPMLHFDDYGMKVAVGKTDWLPNKQKSRMACVNSFGFGGTNCHAIVQEFSQDKVSCNCIVECSDRMAKHIIVLSSTDEQSLLENVKSFQQGLQDMETSLHAVSYTSVCKRTHHGKRVAFVVKNYDELEQECKKLFSNPKLVLPKRATTVQVIFFFCGVGTSWNGMGIELLGNDIFEVAVKRVDQVLMKLTGWSIIDAWKKCSDMKDPLLNHLSIFTYQIGLIAMWDQWGIKPDVIVGQSVGEVAAAYCSGALELKSAVEIIFQRSIALLQCKEGSMLVVRNVPIETVREFCSYKGDTLVISGYNSPTSCVVSGNKGHIFELKQYLKKQNSSALYDIDSPCAYHSPYANKAAIALGAALKTKTINSSDQDIPMISSVTGKLCDRFELESPDYWTQNVRKPVQLYSAIREAKKYDQSTLIVEIGPRPTIRTHIQDIFDGSDSVSVIPSILKENEISQMKKAVSTIYMHGLNPEWPCIVKPCNTNSKLPRYAFSRHFARYEIESLLKVGELTSHRYVSRSSSSFGGDISYVVKINKDTTPFVFQHFVRGVLVVPGATYADVGFEIGKDTLALPLHEIEVSLDFITSIRVSNSGEIELFVQLTPKGDKLISFVVKHGGSVACKGTVGKMLTKPKLHSPVDNFPDSLPKEYTHADIYKQLKQIGFEYGDCCKQITKVHTDGELSVGQIDLHASVVKDITNHNHHFHACVLDCALHLIAMFRNDDVSDGKQNDIKIMPIGFGKVHKYGSFSEQMTAHVVQINRTVMPTMLKEHYNILIYDDCGSVVADIENAAFFCNLTNGRTPDDLKYQMAWEPFCVSGLPDDDNQKNIIIVNGTKDAISEYMNNAEGIIYVDLPKNDESSVETIRDLLESAIEKKQFSDEDIAAILYICESSKCDEEITTDMYNRVIRQCKLVGNFVEMLIGFPVSPPAFVITERVYNNERFSPLGAEVWGYLRNVMQEYIYLDLTLIDVSPSLEKCYSKLTYVVRSKPLLDETTPVELAIYNEQILAAKLVQTRKKEILPRFCNNVCSGSENLVIKSINSEIVSVLPSKPTHMSTVRGNNFMNIAVEFVCLHDQNIYPRYEYDTNTNDVFSLGNKGEGDQLLVLEYCGFEILFVQGKSSFINNGLANNKTSKQKHFEDNEGKLGTAALFPALCAHIITVPKECTISIRKHPWYKPGFLTWGMVCYYLAKLVPVNKNHIGVICNSIHDDSAMIFSRIMAKKKQKLVMLEDGSFDRNDIPNTVVVLRKIDGTVYSCVKQCKEVICLNSMLSVGIKKRLCVTDKVRVIVVDETTLFDETNIKTCLPNVVKLLAKSNLPLFQQKNNIGTEYLVDTSCNGFRLKSKDARQCLHGMKVSTLNMFRKHSIYVVTGGLTGLGWELVIQMADMGAGVIVTFGRRPCSMDMAKTITETERMYSCSICPLVVDVTDEMSVQAAFVEIKKRFPELDVRGVLHGAGVVKSKLFVNRTEENLAENMSPKVVGTINLHNATKSLPLDYFVMHSSINTVFGSHGQSAYGAANSFMNAFAQWRRCLGLTALAINWGALSLGMAAKTTVRKELENKGHILMTTEEIKDCFIHALLHNDNMAIYSNLDKSVIARDFSQPDMVRLQYKLEFLREDGILSNGIEVESQQLNFDLNMYQDLDETAKRDLLSKVVINIVRSVFGCAEEDCTLDTTYNELGLDSMSALMFSNVLFEKTNFRMMHQLLFTSGHALADTVNLFYQFMKQQDESDVFNPEEQLKGRRSSRRKSSLFSTRRESRISRRRSSLYSSEGINMLGETTNALVALPTTGRRFSLLSSNQSIFSDDPFTTALPRTKRRLSSKNSVQNIYGDERYATAISRLERRMSSKSSMQSVDEENPYTAFMFMSPSLNSEKISETHSEQLEAEEDCDTRL